MKWIRTCQECGHKQEDKEPNDTKDDSIAFCNRKCKNCKSSGLDRGNYVPSTPEEIAAYKKRHREWEEQ